MTVSNATVAGGPAATSQPSTINVLNAGARKQAEWALLNELAKLLEIAQENIEQLRDEGLHKWPLTADARGPLQWIAETVEALDALGWQDAIDTSAAAVRREEEDR